jgi:hypothetical protein
MKKLILSFVLLLSVVANAQIKILFDATKAQMAGNADWVIDADTFNLKTNSNGTVTTGGYESNPQRYPTPSQSGITASTTENYWTGALSYWAIDLVKRGYQVETLPYNGKITYGDATNVQDLSNYKVFIICEPNIRFTLSEKNALVNFVANGGGLFMIADHTISDRNNDGIDSPDVFNDISTTNTVKTNPFGITFDIADTNNITSTYYINPTGDPILSGAAGSPVQMQFFSGTTITVNPANNSTAKGIFFLNKTDVGTNTNALIATAKYGSGKVCALGDSSVPDDGTGDTGDSLYDGYITDASGNHRPLLLNATIWLATTDTNLDATDITEPEINIEIYPNPTTDFVTIKGENKNEAFTVSIMDASGKLLLNQKIAEKIDFRKYNKGMYYLVIKSDKGFKSFKVIKK